MTPLTRTQANLLVFLIAFQEQHGYAPTYRDIAEGLGLRSIGTVHRHFVALEARGWLKRHPNAINMKAASFEFVKPKPIPKAAIYLRALLDAIEQNGWVDCNTELVVRIRDSIVGATA
jgi:SOS-response transcriptional repressor LexA